MDEVLECEDVGYGILICCLRSATELLTLRIPIEENALSAQYQHNVVRIRAVTRENGS